MPQQVPLLLNVAFYVLLIWGLASVLSALRVLVESDVWGLWLRAVLFAWLGVPAFLAVSGAFAHFDVTPPPLLRIVVPMGVLVVAFSLSPLGLWAAERLPESLLLGSQGFRLPLELVLYGLAAREILPREMTFAGYNFDILTGVSALVLWYLSHRMRVPRWALWLYNVAGILLLATIVTVAVVSFPEPFGWFHPQNRLVAFYPWVLLPTFLVPLALLSHLLLLRKLLLTARRPAPNK